MLKHNQVIRDSNCRLIWEAYTKNRGYEINGSAIIAGNKKYKVFANFDYENKQIGQKDGKIVVADIPMAIQPTFIVYDYNTGEPVTDQTEKNNIANVLLPMVQKNSKFQKNTKFRQ